MPVVILLIRGRKILSEEPTAPFQLGKFGLALNWVGVIFVVVTSVVCIPRVCASASKLNNFLVFLLSSRSAHIFKHDE